MGRRKRRRVGPIHKWEQIGLLCAWDERVEYERIGPLVLFGGPVPEWAAETGVSERTLYRKIAIAGFGKGDSDLTGACRERSRRGTDAITPGDAGGWFGHRGYTADRSS